MKITLNKQMNGVNTLKDEFLKKCNNDLKKLYIVSGQVKETGFDTIEECLIDNKAKKLIVLGIDKKNTTKKMLENLYKYTKSVYLYNNNKDVELVANIFAFEFKDVSYVYSFGGSVTDSSLETDNNLYTCTQFNLLDSTDKKEYDEYISTIVKDTKSEGYIKLDKEIIAELVESKEIFTTKQYIHNVPSIAELLNSKSEDKEEEVSKEKLIPKIELGDLDDQTFEIDLGEISVDAEDMNNKNDQIGEEKIAIDTTAVQDKVVNASIFESNVSDKVNEETEYVEPIGDAIDMEDLIFESKAVKLDKRKLKKEEDKTTPKATSSKKIDLDKVSNVIMELSKKPTKGQDVDSIKVPNYIKDMIPNFFNALEKGKIEERKEGTFKVANISLEVIDVNNGNKYVDKNAKLIQKKGQTYAMFESDKLIDVIYEEMDIVRIIKLSNTSYHIEVIPQGIDEYKLWKKMCTNNFRGSDRQFGLM